MSETRSMRERLARDFAENYTQKLFYFCLKKTGDSYEAEDLAQEIALNILSALYSGTQPEHFSAWVWQIARNCYSKWADKKHKHSESLTGDDIGDYEIADESANIADELVHNEEMALLRRELAFISADHRNIVMAYYIENRRVDDIAKSLGLPKGTVTSKLHRVRKILKEGMNMAREFGIKSYKPEDVTFSSSGSQPSGLPWRVINRKIPKNILLHASNNPSTLEEISMELGIAMPYMEEEVEILTRATLLKRVEEKYITDFFISDKECQLDTYGVMRRGSRERSELIDKIITDKLPEIRALGIAGDNISDNVIKWWLTIALVDWCVERVDGHTYDWPETRSNGENWGIRGYESIKLPEKLFVGHNGCGNRANMFWTYKIGDYDMWDQIGEPDDGMISALMGDIYRNKRNISSLNENERVVWDKINGKYAHADAEGNVIFDIIVMTNAQQMQLIDMLDSHPDFAKVVANLQKAFDEIINILKRYSHRVLHMQTAYVASSDILQARMMTIHDLVDSGKLIVPENVKKSTAGMHLILA